MGQRRGTLHARHRRIGQPGERAAVRRQPSLQQFDVAADHRQVVVEVVRDAAGEPAHRFHLLRLAQRLLGHFAAANLVPQPRQRLVLPLPLPHCQKAECEQAQRCRNAEDQMRRHVVAPFADHRTPAAAGGDVDRIIRQPAIGDHALDAVDRREAANQAALRPVGDDVGQPPVALVRLGRRRLGIAGERRAVLAQQQRGVVGVAAEQLAVESAEIAGRHADQDGAAESLPRAAAADRDGEHVRTGYPAVDDAADLKRRVAVAQGDEIPAIAEVDAMIRRKARGCDQRASVRAGHQDRGHLAVAGDHCGKPIVQLAFTRDHRIVVEIAEQVVHPAAEQDMGVEHARRLLFGDRERTRQTWRSRPALCRARPASHHRRTPATAAEPTRRPAPTRPTGHRLCRCSRSSPMPSPRCPDRVAAPIDVIVRKVLPDAHHATLTPP